MNKKVKILILSNAIFVILLVTLGIENYTNYSKVITNENTIIKINKQISTYKNKINQFDKVKPKDDSTAKINQDSSEFLNSFFNYDALSKDKIYDNIIPYSTGYLVNKLKPAKENELESDVNYKVSIKNCLLYTSDAADE